MQSGVSAATGTEPPCSVDAALAADQLETRSAIDSAAVGGSVAFAKLPPPAPLVLVPPTPRCGCIPCVSRARPARMVVRLRQQLAPRRIANSLDELAWHAAELDKEELLEVFSVAARWDPSTAQGSPTAVRLHQNSRAAAMRRCAEGLLALPTLPLADRVAVYQGLMSLGENIGAYHGYAARAWLDSLSAAEKAQASDATRDALGSLRQSADSVAPATLEKAIAALGLAAQRIVDAKDAQALFARFEGLMALTGWGVPWSGRSEAYRGALERLSRGGPGACEEPCVRGALCAAAAKGDGVIVRLLLNAGADLDLSAAGRSPLQHAIEAGALACVSQLLEAGASLCAPADSEAGLSALHTAAVCADNEGAALRLVLEHARESRLYIDTPDSVRCTALHHAASRGARACVAALIDAGADPTRCDAQGATPLGAAVEHPSVWPSLFRGLLWVRGVELPPEAQQRLLERLQYGVHAPTYRLAVAHLSGGQGSAGCVASALLAAVEAEHDEMLLLLLALGANPNGSAATPSGAQRTPLGRAAELNRSATVSTLLRSEAVRVDAEDQSGYAALHHAAHKGHGGIVEQLLAAGAKRGSLARKNRWTPLHCAAFGGQSDIASQLIGGGANVNARSSAGATPLSAAAFKDHEGVARDLLNEKTELYSVLRNTAGRASATVYGLILQRALERADRHELVDMGANVAEELAALPPRSLRSTTEALVALLRGSHEGEVIAGGLSAAVALELPNTVELLLNLGACDYLNVLAPCDVSEKHGVRWTPLMWATYCGSEETVALLLCSGASANVLAHDDSALAIAAERGDLSIVSALLLGGANLAAQRLSRSHPLAVAIREGKPRVLEMLLQHVRVQELEQHRNPNAPTLMSLALELPQSVVRDELIAILIGHTLCELPEPLTAQQHSDLTARLRRQLQPVGAANAHEIDAEIDAAEDALSHVSNTHVRDRRQLEDAYSLYA